MKLVRMIESLVGKALPSNASEPQSIVILQRAIHRFSQEELRAARERGWGRRFDGQEDPMYFVSADLPAVTVVKAGPHIIRVTIFPGRYAEDDEYALSQLPQPEQRKAWIEHQAYALLDLFNDLSGNSGKNIRDTEAYASLAQLTPQLGDENCTAIFLPDKNLMMPNDGSAELGLRLLINKEMPLRR